MVSTCSSWEQLFFKFGAIYFQVWEYSRSSGSGESILRIFETSHLCDCISCDLPAILCAKWSRNWRQLIRLREISSMGAQKLVLGFRTRHLSVWVALDRSRNWRWLNRPPKNCLYLRSEEGAAGPAKWSRNWEVANPPPRNLFCGRNEQLKHANNSYWCSGLFSSSGKSGGCP